MPTWWERNNRWVTYLFIAAVNGLVLGYYLHELLSLHVTSRSLSTQFHAVAPIFWGVFVAATYAKLESAVPAETWGAAVRFLLQYCCFLTAVIVGFAFIYVGCGLKGDEVGIDHDSNLLIHDSRSCLYFSAITLTTVGYGDLTPSYEARLWTTVEAITGFLLLGAFIGCFTSILKAIGEAGISDTLLKIAYLKSERGRLLVQKEMLAEKELKVAEQQANENVSGGGI